MSKRLDRISIYSKLNQEIKASYHKDVLTEKIDLAKAVRRLREDKKLSGVELCRRSVSLDPRTLTAVEKGRIKNPSIHTLQALARGLGISVSDFFKSAEKHLDKNFYTGNQKWAFQVEFANLGCRIVSFTPVIRDFFCGKLVMGPRKRVAGAHFKLMAPLFVSTLVGQMEVTVEGNKVVLGEGHNLFFNAGFHHSFYNPTRRESVLLMMTAPSFL
jgi:transcriptional regulator with XRE-family HTH domain